MDEKYYWIIGIGILIVAGIGIWYGTNSGEATATLMTKASPLVCGATGQTCCSDKTNPCTSANSVCNLGTHKCESCGNAGQMCCIDNTTRKGVCPSTTSANRVECFDGRNCEACGNLGQKCCTSDGCYGSGVCSSSGCTTQPVTTEGPTSTAQLVATYTEKPITFTDTVKICGKAVSFMDTRNAPKCNSIWGNSYDMFSIMDIRGFTDTINEYQTKTLLIDGIEYQVQSVLISPTTNATKFVVNGEATDTLSTGQTYNFASGSSISVVKLFIAQNTTASPKAVISLNGMNMTLNEYANQTVLINGVTYTVEQVVIDMTNGRAIFKINGETTDAMYIGNTNTGSYGTIQLKQLIAGGSSNPSNSTVTYRLVPNSVTFPETKQGQWLSFPIGNGVGYAIVDMIDCSKNTMSFRFYQDQC